MAGFEGLPDFHLGPDDRLILDAPLVYVDEHGERWSVPIGFATDLASVPRWLPGAVRLLFRGQLATSSAAILHDYLYATWTLPRAEADRLFWEALRHSGEGRVGAWVMWAGVRAGGWVAWREHRADEG